MFPKKSIADRGNWSFPHRQPIPADLDTRASELYRQVFVSLKIPKLLRPVMIGITSAIRGEGRSTVATGMARTLSADLDVPVLLVEADLARPSLARHFQVAEGPGLCDVLRDDRVLTEVRHRISENLWLIPAGDAGLDAARLSHLLPPLLRHLPEIGPFNPPLSADLQTRQPLREEHPAPNAVHSLAPLVGVIILDLAPLLGTSYSALAASAADVTIMVIRAGTTTIDVVHKAIARLEDQPPQGVVFNGARSSLPKWWHGDEAE